MSTRRATPALVLAGLGLSACAQVTASQPHSPPTGSTVSVTIPGADRFSPFAAEVRQGSPIVFRNMDGDPHTVTSVPGDSATFDVTIPPGGTTTISLTAPGVHRYYCRLHARFDTATGEVAALPSADHPDEPMMGVLVMQPSG